MYVSTITQKGQATIPVYIRKKLGLKPGGKIMFEEQTGQIVIKNQAYLIDELYGSLKPKVKIQYSNKQADKAIGKFLAAEHLKKYGKAG